MANIYETPESVAQYLLFHYGGHGDQMPWPFGPMTALDYPIRSVSALLDPGALPANARALDLGCAVGRSTFELARHCHEVIGIDFSQAFVDAAERVRAEGSLAYTYAVEGEIRHEGVALRPQEIIADRVQFRQGDAMELPSDIGIFDVVHMANLIDRLTHPRKCLDRLAQMIRPGGQLLLASPFTWLEEFTEREEWIGGLDQDGVPLQTADALKQTLAPHFQLEVQTDLPFLIREHYRKYQWSVAYGARFIRRDT